MVPLLAAIIPISVFLLIVLRQTKYFEPRKRSLDEVIPLVSSRAKIDELERLFDPLFGCLMTVEKLTVTERIRVLRNWGRNCRSALVAVGLNAILFQELGRGLLVKTHGKAIVSFDREDHLAKEIFERATACRVLLAFIQVRLQLWILFPSVFWPMLGIDTVYAGRKIVAEYEALVEAALCLSKIQGDYYYENLLCAL